MSLEAITWAYRTEVGSPTRKSVLLVLANYADEEDSSYPGIPRIAKMTELSERSVQRALDDLREMGVIRVEERFFEGTRSHRTNRFHLDLTWCQSVTRVVTGRHQGGDTVTPNTKENREETANTPSRASRRDVNRSLKSTRKQRGAPDTDKGLARTGSLPDDEEPLPPDAPAPRPERGWSTFTLVNEFARRAFCATDVPPAARDTNKGALGKTIKKWLAQETATPDEIAAAMEAFFVAPATRIQGESTLWLAFVNHYSTLSQQTKKKSMYDPDYYQEPDVKHTLAHWAATR